MGRWVKVTDESSLEELSPSQPSRYIDVEGYDVVLFRLREGYGALDDVCSHEYSRLSEGEVWDDRVYCAKHGSSFDCRTGGVRGLPATDDVKSYPTKVEDGAIFIELPDWE